MASSWAGGTVEANAPVDDTCDIQVIVNKEVLKANVVMVKGKARGRLANRAGHTGNDSVPEEMARETIL